MDIARLAFRWLLMKSCLQAWYFKSMLKGTNHLSAAKRMGTSDLAPLMPNYEAGGVVSCTARYRLTPSFVECSGGAERHVCALDAIA